MLGCWLSSAHPIPATLLLSHKVVLYTEMQAPNHDLLDTLRRCFEKTPGEWTLGYDAIPAPLDAVKARAVAGIQAEYLHRRNAAG